MILFFMTWVLLLIVITTYVGLHIKKKIIKCNKVNGMIRRAVGYKAPTSVTLNLYLALIDP